MAWMVGAKEWNSFLKFKRLFEPISTYSVDKFRGFIANDVFHARETIHKTARIKPAKI